MSAPGHSYLSNLVMSGYKCLFYLHGRPTRIGKALNDVGEWLGKRDIGPQQQLTMDVRGRVSGEIV